jgi:diguanylate cyclase (GGDEF)-like protein
MSRKHKDRRKLNMTKDLRIVLAFTALIALALTAVFMYFILQTATEFETFYGKKMENHAVLIRKTVSLAESYIDTYDQLVTDDLYHRLYRLNQELLSVAHTSLTKELMESYRDKYKLAGLAIFVSEPGQNTARIHISTVDAENDKTTEDWGYWHDAIISLLAGETPDVNRGIAKENYWAGPRSRSYYMDGFYRYGYYHNARQGYLVNGYVQDNASSDQNIRNLLDELFVYLDEEVSYISGISLIDLKAWEVAYHNNYSNLEDPAFLYGNFNRDLFISLNLTPDELFSIQDTQTYTLGTSSRRETIYLINAGVEGYPYLVAAHIDDTDHRALISSAAASFMKMGVVALVVVLVGLTWIMRRYQSQITYQKERKEASEAFARSIAVLPEFIYRCRLSNEDQLLFTYNDGRSVDRNQVVSRDKHFRPLEDLYPETYIETIKPKVKQALAGTPQRFEMDYNQRIYEHFISKVEDEEEVAGFATDITEKRQQEDKVRHQAQHDSLTKLKNRKVFEEFLTSVVGQQNRDPYVLFFMDLDRFKEVNDRLGHLIGDMVLVEAAQRIQKTVDGQDGILSRVGGDEFALLYRSGDRKGIEEIAKAVIAAFTKPFELDGSQLNIGISIGIALYPDDTIEKEKLLYFADQAMYAVKNVEGKKYAFHRK